MRDVKRLDPFYTRLCELHKKYFPDWRFGQVLVNFLRWYGKDPFYLEEDKFLTRFEEFVEAVKEGVII